MTFSTENPLTDTLSTARYYTFIHSLDVVEQSILCQEGTWRYAVLIMIYS
jgi:hypothetical protein